MRALTTHNFQILLSLKLAFIILNLPSTVIAQSNDLEVFCSDVEIAETVNRLNSPTLFLRAAHPILYGDLTCYPFSSRNSQLLIRETTLDRNHNLEETRFFDTGFNGITIADVNFFHSAFGRSDFLGSIFEGTDFAGSKFSSVDFSFASFRRVNLSGVRFHNVTLFMTDLEGIDLSGSFGLTTENVESACGDDTTLLPRNIDRPAHWPCDPIAREWLSRIGSAIPSNHSIYWMGDYCSHLYGEFQEAVNLPPRPEVSYVRATRALRRTSDESFFFSDVPIVDSNPPYDSAVIPQQESCDRVYMYSDFGGSLNFVREIECRGDYCGITGSGSEDSPGQPGIVVARVRDGTFTDEALELIERFGAYNIEHDIYMGRDNFMFDFEYYVDRALIALLQDTELFESVERLYDGIGGESGLIIFEDRGVFSDLAISAEGQHVGEWVLERLKRVLPASALIRERGLRTESSVVFIVENVRGFGIVSNEYWERYEIHFLFDAEPPIDKLYYFIQGSIAPGVGNNPPATERYVDMEPDYRTSLEHVAALIAQQIQFGHVQ